MAESAPYLRPLQTTIRSFVSAVCLASVPAMTRALAAVVTTLLAIGCGGRGPEGPQGPEDNPVRTVRTVVVSPFGTNVQNGTALLNAIAGITTASATNKWLLKIEPGTYDTGSLSFQMKPFVDVEGSGQLVTTILSVVDGGGGTVTAASDAELRNLTVANTSTGTNVQGIDGANTLITDVTVTVVGAVQVSGILNQRAGASRPFLFNVLINAEAATGRTAYGIYNYGVKFPRQRDDRRRRCRNQDWRLESLQRVLRRAAFDRGAGLGHSDPRGWHREPEHRLPERLQHLCRHFTGRHLGPLCSTPARARHRPSFVLAHDESYVGLNTACQ